MFCDDWVVSFMLVSVSVSLLMLMLMMGEATDRVMMGASVRFGYSYWLDRLRILLLIAKVRFLRGTPPSALLIVWDILVLILIMLCLLLCCRYCKPLNLIRSTCTA